MGRHRNGLLGFLLQLVLLLATAITHQETTNGAVAAMQMQQAAAAVGSRPPSCEGRCRSSCGQCQAVQVPVTPADLLNATKTTTKTMTSSSRRGGGARSRRAAVVAQLHQQAAANYDDHSNYKPLSWRCKCRVNS